MGPLVVSTVSVLLPERAMLATTQWVIDGDPLTTTQAPFSSWLAAVLPATMVLLLLMLGGAL